MSIFDCILCFLIKPSLSETVPMGGGKVVTTYVLVQWGLGSHVLVEKRQNSLELSSVALELSSMPLLSETLSCLNTGLV